MSYAQLTNRGSLRDIENCLTALSSRLYHCGISYAVPRNTLAKANEKRDWRIYADFAQVLVKKVRPLYAKDDFRLDLDNMVYAFDSSTISLCLKLCPWAKFRKHKGGIKMHTLLDLRGNLPVSVYLTEASVHDVKALDYLYIEPSAIYLMDKGYVDFYRLFHLIHEKNAFFVTRAKDNMRFDITACCEVERLQSQNFIGKDGMWSFSSNGSSNTCTSNPSMEHLRMLSISRFGLPFIHTFYWL